MRAVIQKCLRSSVRVDSEVVSSIGRGYNVLVGICAEDTAEDVAWLVNKILKVRLWHDWRYNIGEAHLAGPRTEGERVSAASERPISEPLEILCISQFTLYAKLRGNKPDFHLAMKSADARPLYEAVLKGLRDGLPPINTGKDADKTTATRVKDGVFGAMMAVEIVNDGRKPPSTPHVPAA
ncbi:D-tyrosyl-tRNA(Tyr) deacylase [Savitreella phatthalungensis]